MTVHEFADLLEDLINEYGYERVKRTILWLLSIYDKESEEK